MTREWVLRMAVLVAAVGATFGGAIFTDRVFFECDILNYWGPAHRGFRPSRSRARLAPMEPVFAVRRPLLADPSLALAYPPTWLNLVIDPGNYYKLLVVSHCAGLGVLLLARHWGLPRTLRWSRHLRIAYRAPSSRRPQPLPSLHGRSLDALGPAGFRAPAPRSFRRKRVASRGRCRAANPCRLWRRLSHDPSRRTVPCLGGRGLQRKAPLLGRHPAVRRSRRGPGPRLVRCAVDSDARAPRLPARVRNRATRAFTGLRPRVPARPCRARRGEQVAALRCLP